MTRIEDLGSFNQAHEAGLAKLLPSVPRIAVGMGTCGMGNGAEAAYHAFADAIESRGLGVKLVPTGCFGSCAEEPLVNVWIPGKPLVILRRVQARDTARILDHLTAGKVPTDLALCKIEEWDHITSHVKFGTGYPELPHWHQVPFFHGQKRIVLRHCGLINPSDIEEYFAVGGYQALYKVLIDSNPERVIEQIKLAKLRGRGGAGFPTGLKWEILRNTTGDQKYIVCNADEGDPGAYMNRNEIESDPHSMIEGMIIGGFVTGASRGIIYVRAEYPLAVHRLQTAVDQARDVGLLGKNILGRGFRFDLELVEGAGAFVCGEETALIHSLEGKAGRPRPRPPYPAQKGLFDRPTNINNVETWYNIAPIVLRGPGWFSETGSSKSAGTKVFSLVGKVQRTGLVEMPLGTPLKTFVYDIGGGALAGNTVKAVQTGGPSGGCIPQEMFDTPVDYESLAQLGSIMGSGGMVVMDDDNCMVDFARYFVEFTHSESCGKCVPCRAGLDQALRILNRFTHGTATEADLHTLDELSRMMRDLSLCALGQSAPNPVLTTLRHFLHEFHDHIRAHRCRAGVCEQLALSPCENSCPLHINIPRYLELLKAGRLEEAFLSLVLDNPLPASTGRVCQHPCDDRCRRSGVDESVNMREVHRYIADTIHASAKYPALIQAVVSRKFEKSGRRVAVVGAGPTGLTAAYYLALLGHEVEVYDSNPEPGGMLRYALPQYRLPKTVIENELALIRAVGVTFHCNLVVGKDVALNDLGASFDAVFLSIGTWKESWVYLPGTELRGVVPALNFLEEVAKGWSVSIGKSVVVVGGGNAAIDSARTAKRLGAAVTIVYRRDRRDMPAIAEEVKAAEEEGIEIAFYAAPHRILGDDAGGVKAMEAVRTQPGEFDASGRRKPVMTDEIMRFDCETVILAVGETVDLDFIKATGLKLKPDNKGLEVDSYSLETSRTNFYAGGDLITGASNVSNAMGFGKRAAKHIDQRLMGVSRFQELWPRFEYKNVVPLQPSERSRQHIRERDPERRVLDFDDATIGLSPVEAIEECGRCLRCDVRPDS
ncbi:MAG: FAD-dependent oxidoreductase [Myxococcales bacterium]